MLSIPVLSSLSLVSIPRAVNKNLDEFFALTLISPDRIGQHYPISSKPWIYQRGRPMDVAQVEFLKSVLKEKNLIWDDLDEFCLLLYKNVDEHDDVPSKVGRFSGMFFHVVLRGTGMLIFPKCKSKPAIHLKRGVCFLMNPRVAHQVLNGEGGIASLCATVQAPK